MTEFSRNILAKGLGDYLLTYMEEKPYQADGLVEGKCAYLVKEIMEAMDDLSLDDFACLEKIITVLHSAGLNTDRHDF